MKTPAPPIFLTTISTNPPPPVHTFLHLIPYICSRDFCALNHCAGVAAVGRRVVGAVAGWGSGPSSGWPAGWTGKLWALKQGIDAGMALPRVPDSLLLTDADIVHAADSVSRLVARAEATGTVLTSLMVKLRCESLAERANIPAFIFFFQM